MLTKEERSRLDACLSIINFDLEKGRVYPNLEIKTVEWLVLKLIETNNELIEIDKLKTAISKMSPEQQHSDTVSLDTPNGTKLIATWDKTSSCYRCLFCDMPTFTATAAAKHAAKEHTLKP